MRQAYTRVALKAKVSWSSWRELDKTLARACCGRA